MKYFKPSAAILATLLGSAIVIAAPGGNKADANGDGILTKAEASAATQARFAKMDSNGDGSISESEFNAAREAKKAKRAEGKATGGDKKGKGKKAGRGGKGGKAMLKKADANGDNSITLAEFTAFSDARFAKADTNSDGQITKEERKAAHADRGGKGKKGRDGKGRGQ